MDTKFKLKLEKQSTSSSIIFINESTGKPTGYATPGVDGYYSFTFAADSIPLQYVQWSEEVLKEIVTNLSNLNKQWEERINSL